VTGVVTGAFGVLVAEGVAIGVVGTIVLVGWGTVVPGAAGFNGGSWIGVEGRGMRVTGVIGERATFGRGIGSRFPEGGGIRVTGVPTIRGVMGVETGPCISLLGTGGMGADLIVWRLDFGGDIEVPSEGGGIVVTGVLGTGVTGVSGFNTGGGTGDVLSLVGSGAAGGRGVGVAGVDKEDFGVPKRLAARMYCANAACCSGVAVLFATACRIALNSGLAAAISVSALTVSALELVVVGVVGMGAGAGCLGGGAALAAFSAFSSTLRTDRNLVSGNM
jgi:hypothetical protein